MQRNKTQVLILVAFAIILVVNLFLVNQFGSVSLHDEAQQIAQIEKAIKHAAVQCYALEGSYPDQVSYLEDNYGITYDRQLFFVHYRYDGANFLPQVQVFATFSEF